MSTNNTAPEGAKQKQSPIKLIIFLAIIVGIVFALWKSGAFEYISKKENIQALKAQVESFGIMGPIIYIVLWIGVAVFFVPALPVALLGGFVFGPWMGTLYSSLGSTIGAACAFLVARYAARSMVEGWVGNNPQFKKIDEGVAKEGWRILLTTRLVPAFPYNIQNYIYGLTKINLVQFFFVSWICMLPGAVAFSFAGAAGGSGEGMGKTLMYLGIAAIFFVIISMIPKWLAKKQQAKNNPAA